MSNQLLDLMERMPDMYDRQRLAEIFNKMKHMDKDLYTVMNMFIYALELFLKNRSNTYSSYETREAINTIIDDITLMCPIEFSTRYSANPAHEMFKEAHQFLWYYRDVVDKVER
jgi:hypothetical protein